MRYTFQRSKLWEAGGPVDTSTAPVTVKMPPGKGESQARRKLPSPGTGRVWVLTKMESATEAGKDNSL